jgi:hypothetical protein
VFAIFFLHAKFSFEISFSKKKENDTSKENGGCKKCKNMIFALPKNKKHTKFALFSFDEILKYLVKVVK